MILQDPAVLSARQRAPNHPGVITAAVNAGHRPRRRRFYRCSSQVHEHRSHFVSPAGGSNSCPRPPPRTPLTHPLWRPPPAKAAPDSRPASAPERPPFATAAQPGGEGNDPSVIAKRPQNIALPTAATRDLLSKRF